MADVWDRPEVMPITIAPDATEGYPAPAAWDVVNIYGNVGATRRNRILLGVTYADIITGELAETPDEVEGGRFDEMRRLLFSALNKLRRFHWLALGPYGWQVDYPIQGDEGVSPNFAHVYQFPATGSGTTLTIRWQPGTGYSAHDARSLSLSPTDTTTRTSLQPCMGVIIDRPGGLGMAEIVDVEYQGEITNEEGTYHYATITLDKSLGTIAGGALWIIREHRWAAYPHPRLGLAWSQYAKAGRRCRHSVKVEHSALESFAAAYPEAAMAAGIEGGYYCAKMNLSGVLLDGYWAACAQTDCPHYSAYEPYIPTAEDYNAFWLGRGVYLRQTGPEADDWRIGREGYSGILQLLGFPVGYQYGGGVLYLAAKLYYGQGGLLKYKTGDTDSYGFDEFQTFGEWQADQTGETDAFPLLTGIDAPTVYDSCGGKGYDDRELDETASRTPGAIFAANTGMRRLGYDRAGVAAATSGPGDAGVQRVMPRCYTSRRFANPPAEASSVNDETWLSIYSSNLSIGGFSYNAAWKLPRFGQRTDQTYTDDAAEVSPYVYSASISGDVLWLELSHGSRTLTTRIDSTTTADVAYYMGGTNVAGDVAWEISNPAGAARIGDRQWGLYPGRSIDIDTLPGVRLTCISAQPMAGTYDNEIDNLPAEGTVPGIPAYVRSNFRKRDVAKFAIEPVRAAQIAEWAPTASGSRLSVAYSSVAPPTTDHTGAQTYYLPRIYAIEADGEATELVAGTHYEWEPANGMVYVNTAALPTGIINLFWQGWVFDVRRTHPAELAIALDRAVDGLLAGWLTVGSFYYPEADLPTFYSAIAREYVRWQPRSIVSSAAWTSEGAQESQGGDPEIEGYTYPGGLDLVTASQPNWAWGGSVAQGAIIPDDPVLNFDYWIAISGMTAPAMNISLGAFRYAAEDIASAVCDIAIKGPTRLVNRLVIEDGVVTENTSSTTYVAVGFGVAFALITYDGESIADIKSTSSVAADNWSVVEINGDDYATATANCTQALKEIIALMRDNSEETFEIVAYLAWPSDGGDWLPATLSQYLTAWSWSRRVGDGAEPERQYFSYTGQYGGIMANSVEFGNLRIRLAPGALTRGAVYHFDATGQSNAPDLLHGED